MKPKLALILLITVVSFSTSFANLTLFADVTGDGTEEFLEFKNDGVYVEGLRWVQGFGANNGWTESRHLRMAEDLDSDGKADIIGFGETDVWVAYSTGSNFSVPTIILSNGPCIANGFTIEQHPRLLGDLREIENANVPLNILSSYPFNHGGEYEDISFRAKWPKR